MPGLSKLYSRDFTIRPAIIAFAFGLLVAAVIGWGAPTSSPDPSVDLSFEIEMSKRVPPVALAFSALAALVVWWRYRTVKQILMEGAIVTGVVQQLHRHGTRTNNEEYATVRPVYSYSYWVTVLYTIGGASFIWAGGDPSPMLARFDFGGAIGGRRVQIPNWRSFREAISQPSTSDHPRLTPPPRSVI